MATEVTLAHHVEKAVDNTSDVDCVAYHAIVLDSVLCQSPRHTRQANEIHALTIRFLNTQYCVTGRNRPNRIRFIKIVVISRLYSGPMPLRKINEKQIAQSLFVAHSTEKEGQQVFQANKVQTNCNEAIHRGD